MGGVPIVNSPDAGVLPIVSTQYLMRRPLPWKTVRFLDCSANGSCQNAFRKSSLENIFDPESCALMSSCLGMGRLLDIVALFKFLASKVNLEFTVSTGNFFMKYCDLFFYLICAFISQVFYFTGL